jgi:hypothetical protein
LPISRSRAISVILTTVSQSRSFCSRLRVWSGVLRSGASRQFSRTHLWPDRIRRVEDAPLDAARQFAHVDRLDAHAQVSLEEALVHDRAGDAHRNAAQRQVGLAAHDRGGEAGPPEAQQLLLHVGRDRGIAGVLDVAAVDAKAGKPFWA